MMPQINGVTMIGTAAHKQNLADGVWMANSMP